MKNKLIIVGILVSLILLAQFDPGQPDTIHGKQSPSKVVRQNSLKHKYICLTFDDGPDPIYTPKILEVLKKHNASATFFFLGTNIKKCPELVNKVISDGHEIGIHSYNHLSLVSLSEYQVQTQINKTYQLVYNIAGYKPVLFRPPYGFVNKKVISAARKKDLKLVFWSRNADPKDFRNPGVDKIAKRVLASADQGIIVLLHDHGGNRMQTVEAVDKIISQLSPKGYSFVTVSTLLKESKSQDVIVK